MRTRYTPSPPPFLGIFFFSLMYILAKKCKEYFSLNWGTYNHRRLVYFSRRIEQFLIINNFKWILQTFRKYWNNNFSRNPKNRFQMFKLSEPVLRIRILDPHWKKGIRIPFFSLIFILKLDEPFRNEEICIISFFSKVQIWALGVKKFYLQFLIDISPLGSGSGDPCIFADPNPGS